MEPEGGLIVRTVLATLLVAAGIALGTSSTAPAQPAQGFYGYGGYTYGWGGQYGYNFIPACPISYHYACWHDPYGYQRCGCVVSERWW